MKRTVTLAMIVWLSSLGLASAQDTSPAAILTKPEVVLSGLDSPTFVAIQPVTGTIFVADTGTGKVTRATDGKQQSVVTGFPTESMESIPTFVFSPLTLAFISRDTLVVGGGGTMDGEDLVRFYSVPATGVSIKAADAIRTLGPIKPQAGMTGIGGGNVGGVAVADNAVYATTTGDSTQGWITRAKLADGRAASKLTRFIATKKSAGNVPNGITLTHNGHLLVAQRGETTKPKDSLISFYRSRDGQEMLTLATGLHDITGLAYSPATGRLYATDYAWSEPKSGGIYRLDRDFVDGRQVCKPTPIAKLDRPTALAFGKQGELYVTVFGPKATGMKSGKLVKFAKGL